MLGLLWLVVALPFIGFLLLAPFGRRLSRQVAAAIGVGSVGVSAILALIVAGSFLASPPPGNSFTQVLWTWISVSNFTPQIAFRLDALSLVMMLVVTFVGSMIHLYSSAFMADEEGYSRFFAYMNLFVGSMLTLVLADNLLLLYLGWEGVGLCSYLLIGFWYRDPENGHAARKAFVVTRVGDTALAIGLFILFSRLGTFQIQELMSRASEQWAVGSGFAVAAAALLLGGAVGKSAQLPLQTWLPDAMAGPTPVSALIHAATMVTAGVYLIARTNVLFALAPAVQLTVAIIGALTLLLAGFSALTQHDIKRVLAYSTMSQIGYMFLALGVGAQVAAIFHFMTHAFFKALLFLSAGVIILRLNREHDIFKMGGLRTRLPLVFWTFLIGSASLAAVPFITAGFYSKDLILWEAWSGPNGNPWLWAAGLVGALLTSLYTFRMVFIAFYREPSDEVKAATPIPGPGFVMGLPLVVLATLSVIGGFLQTPSFLGNIGAFGQFVSTILPPLTTPHGTVNTEAALEAVAIIVALGGILAAWRLFLARRSVTEQIVRTAPARLLHQFWFVGWGFDWLYDTLLVRPYIWLATEGRDDVVDLVYQGTALVARLSNQALSLTQTGRVRLYALGITIGAIVIVGMVVLL